MHHLPHQTALLSLLLLLLLAGPAGQAVAQQQAPTESRDRIEGDGEERNPAALLGDQFVMMAHEALAGHASPRPDQFRRARLLLDIAVHLRDDDAELWRLRAELAQRMEDRDNYRDAMRRYVRLRPEDDVAQLQILLDGLRELQTLDARLERLEAILQSGSGQRLSRPLRSRLASHAAIAAEELGDEERLARWLVEAARLDPANPEAAELTYALARRGNGGAVAEGTALVNLVRAAPADPLPRLRLARWLTDQAVYSAAARQFDTALILMAGPLPPDIYADWAVALAASGDTTAARQLINQVAPPTEGDDAGSGAPQPDAAMPADELPDLRLGLEIIRLALLDQRPEEAARSFARVRAMVNEAVTGSADDADWLTRPDGDATEAGGRLLLAWVAAVFNQALDEVPQWLAEQPDDDPLVRRARGWLHVHRGEVREAFAQFEPTLDSDPLAALGVAMLRSPGSGEQTETLQRVVRQDGSSVAALLAARMLNEAGRDVRRTAAGGSVAVYMERSPMHLWRPALTVAPWTSMQLSVTPQRLHPLDPLHATIELRNTSRMPMPIATGRGTPERVLLSASPAVDGEPLEPSAPVIVDVRRRLTLEPGEAMRVTVRLDRSALGALMREDLTRRLSFNLLGVLGPRPTGDGGIAAEPAGGVESVRAILVQPVELSADQVDAWLQQLDSDAPADRLHALAHLLRSVDHLPREMETADHRRRIAEAVNRRFPEMDPVQQAWTVRFLSDSERSRELFRRIVDAAERSDDVMVRVAYMATHLDGTASPAMNAALRHDNATIRTFARALQEAADAPEPDADAAPLSPARASPSARPDEAETQSDATEAEPEQPASEETLPAIRDLEDALRGADEDDETDPMEAPELPALP